MASQNIARLGVVLGLDTAEFTASIDKAIAENVKLKNAIRRETDAAAKEIVALKYATDDYGKVVSKVTQIEREMAAGRFKNATSDMKKQLLDQAKAYDAVATSAKNATGAQFKMNEQQKMALTYQTTDLITQLASGQSPFIAILQQGGQLKDQMGGIGNAFKAIGTFITPFNVGIAAAAAYVGSLSFAMYQANDELDKFNDALTLSGNYAGITAKQWSEMSASTAASTRATIGDSKSALLELISSGKFTEESIGAVQKAVLTYASIAKISGVDAAKALASGLSGSAAEAKSLNDKMNFLTIEQYKHIEALDKAGKKQEAAKELSIALTTQLELQSRALGPLEAAWNKVTKSIDSYWNKLKETMAAPSIQQNIDALSSQIEKVAANAEKMKGIPGFGSGSDKLLATLKAEKEALLEVQRLQARAVSAKDVGGSKGLIADRMAAGGAAKEEQLIAESEKLRNDIKYQKAIEFAGEEQKIKEESLKKIKDKEIEYAHKTAEEKRAFGGQLETNLSLEIEKIQLERNQKLHDLAHKRYLQELDLQIAAMRHQEELDKQLTQKKIDAELAVFRSVQTEKDAVSYQKEKLDLQISMIGNAKKELDIALLKLETEKEIAKWKRSEEYGLLSEENQKFYEEEKRKAAAAKETNIVIADSLLKMKEVSDSVWGNISGAIDTFVKTGKFAFKDFAKSVIQDLIAIQMKSQALALINMGLKAMGFGFQLPGKAVGGPVSGGSPYLIGEKGPEMFIPSGSGTIIPNNQLSGMGGTTNVTNNYINAIDTKSFEDRLLGSSNAVWAANQYAGKNLATNFGRT